MGHDTWILSDHEFPWLLDPDGSFSWFSGVLTLLTRAEVTVTKILHSISGVETWITSDGRAYFVRLQESRHSEEVSERDEEETDKVRCPVLLLSNTLT
jgi:hypothetical protein